MAKSHEIQLDAPKIKRYQAEQTNEPFTEQATLNKAAMIWEPAIGKTDELGNDLIATFVLIGHCFDVIESVSPRTMVNR